MSDDYKAKNISVLKGLESVRKNPGMYVGDSGILGLHHLIWEVVDNSVDEAMAGHCNEIGISIAADGCTISVSDNGRGIPVDEHPEEKKSALELVLTVLHAGGKFESGAYTASGGLHGVGLSCVNALAGWLRAEVKRDGYVWYQEFRKGAPTSKIKRDRPLKKGERHGTTITWRADTEIFKSGNTLQDSMLVKRLQEIAFLNSGLKVTLENHATKKSEEWHYTGGIIDYMKYLSAGKDTFPAEPIHGQGSSDLEDKPGKCVVQIALQYARDDDGDTTLGFTNNIAQADGGTHVSGFQGALTRAINQMARKSGLLKENEDNISGRDAQEGLLAIVSIRYPRPEFGGQTKSKLTSNDAKSIVTTIAYDVLIGYFEKNAGVLKEIVNRAKLAAKAREAAKKSSDLVRRKGLLSRSNRLPGKLSDCISKKRVDSELFIVEGDSAGGGAKDGRNPQTQAVLPVKGKVINAEKNNLISLLKNEEVQALITAIGTGIKDECDLDRLRYNKIIIMSDADDDGHHISTLLMTFFYRYMRPLIEYGHIYLAQPPLYCAEISKDKREYCFNDKELQKVMAKHPKSRVVRFKGLGEMNSNQLASTTMDPENRHLIRVTIDDAAETERMVSVLMGKDAQLRKIHITESINK